MPKFEYETVGTYDDMKKYARNGWRIHTAATDEMGQFFEFLMEREIPVVNESRKTGDHEYAIVPQALHIQPVIPQTIRYGDAEININKVVLTLSQADMALLKKAMNDLDIVCFILGPTNYAR